MNRWLARCLLALGACSGKRPTEPPIASAPTELAGARWVASRGDVTAATWAPSWSPAETDGQPLRIRVDTAAGTTDLRGWAAATATSVYVVTPGLDLANAVVRSWPGDRQTPVAAPTPDSFVRGIWCTPRDEHCALVWWSPKPDGFVWHIEHLVAGAAVGGVWRLDVDDAGLLLGDHTQTIAFDVREPVLYVIESRGPRSSVVALDLVAQRPRWRREIVTSDPPAMAPPIGAAALEVTGDGKAIVVVVGMARWGAVQADHFLVMSTQDGTVLGDHRFPLGSTTSVASSVSLDGPYVGLLGVLRFVDGGGHGAFRNLGEIVGVFDATTGSVDRRKLPAGEQAPSAIVAQGASYALVAADRPWHSYPAVPADWPSASAYDLPATIDAIRTHLGAARAALSGAAPPP